MLNSPKTPQFAKAKLSPLAIKTDACHGNDCCSNATVAPETEMLPDTGERYSWLVDGMDCAACARKVENAVKQIGRHRNQRGKNRPQQVMIGQGGNIGLVGQ